MDSITLQNYRCFGSEEQTARLAPLTLLVGPNSTGKTSFLALIRALWDVAFREVVPNFREEPFDLGSFEDIAHNDGSRNGPCRVFRVGFGQNSHANTAAPTTYRVIFTDQYGSPFPEKRRISRGQTRWEVSRIGAMEHTIGFATPRGDWERDVNADTVAGRGIGLMPFQILFWERFLGQSAFGDRDCGWRSGSHDLFDEGDVQAVRELSSAVADWNGKLRPYASSPVRSRPRRTYDPALNTDDPEGEDIPSFLANLARRSPDAWETLRHRLEDYGRSSGLFDEIWVRSFGASQGDPFQIQTRKFGKRRKGPRRNLIDVGYGISQVLPILTQLLRDDASTMLLLQQPEVHLHPQAQAALGTLFCQVAAEGRQLVVETHSDYIIDRVRMDVRDQTTGLKPEDVSILYFEPRDLDVKIYSIRLDEIGNVLDAPLSYGKFFMAETRRSIGL